MRGEKFAILVALSLVAFATMAADPPAPGAATAPKAPGAATAVQTPAAVPATGAPAAAAQASANDSIAIAKQAHILGYSPRSRAGKTVYCKAEASLGTRLESMKCFSEQEMTAVVQRSIANQDSVAKMQRTELYEENKH